MHTNTYIVGEYAANEVKDIRQTAGLFLVHAFQTAGKKNASPHWHGMQTCEQDFLFPVKSKRSI